MKLITLIFVFLALAFTFEKNTAQKNEANLSTMDILQSILSDPEFLALRSQEQLRIWLIIYNILESHYKA